MAASAAGGAAAVAIAMAVAAASCSSSDSSSVSGGSGGVGGGFGGGTSTTASCTSSAACLPGQFCCDAIGSLAPASCQTGSCPAGETQLCALSAECLEPHYVCGPQVLSLPFGTAMACGLAPYFNPDATPDDASNGTGDATLGDGSGNDAPPPGDGPVSDGVSPGDASSQGDGPNDLDAGWSDVTEASLHGG